MKGEPARLGRSGTAQEPSVWELGRRGLCSGAGGRSGAGGWTEAHACGGSWGWRWKGESLVIGGWGSRSPSVNWGAAKEKREGGGVESGHL